MSRIDQLDIIVRHQDDQAVASIPQIFLYAKADTAAAAVELLEQKKRKLLEQVASAGLTDEDVIVSTATPVRASPTSLMREIGVFALKSAIIIAFLAGLTTFAAIKADAVLQRTRQDLQASLQRTRQDLQARADAVVQQASSLSGRQFWTRVEANLDRLANSGSDLPEEKKKKLLSDIQIIVQRWRPFVAETMAILATDPKSPAMPDSNIRANK